MYIGETSTTGYIRGNEHRYQYRHHGLGNPSGKDSVLGRHVVERHGEGRTVQSRMVVLSHNSLNQVGEGTGGYEFEDLNVANIEVIDVVEEEAKLKN